MGINKFGRWQIKTNDAFERRYDDLTEAQRWAVHVANATQRDVPICDRERGTTTWFSPEEQTYASF